MLNQILNRDSTGLSAAMGGLKLDEWSPLKNLPKRYQDEILSRSQVQEFAPNDFIFRVGEDNEKDFYLLEGSVELLDKSGKVVKTLTHSGQQSLELIDHSRPRNFTARSTQASKVFVTRRTFFDTLNSAESDLNATVEVNEIDMEGSGNWMLHMLNSSVFSTLPPENLQQIFISMETIKVQAGTTLITQGQPGEYFYLIQYGDCVITHTDPAGETKELYHLDSGETFGERSLILEGPSDVTVEAITDGVVMQIPKETFKELIQDPLLERITIEKADTLIAEGAGWIDVRTPEKYKELAIKNSLNIDLNALYTASKGLDNNKTWIVCGDSPEQAMASAFLLSIKGFSVYSLTASTNEYLETHPEATVSVQKIAEQEKPEPVLEKTVEDEELPILAPTEAFEKTADDPPQIRLNRDAVSNNFQDLSKNIEQAIRKEINDLIILKQKELEKEINERFQKYHLVTAKLMKKKLDDLEQVYKVQSKLAKKNRSQ